MVTDGPGGVTSRPVAMVSWWASLLGRKASTWRWTWPSCHRSYLTLWLLSLSLCQTIHALTIIVLKKGGDSYLIREEKLKFRTCSCIFPWWGRVEWVCFWLGPISCIAGMEGMLHFFLGLLKAASWRSACPISLFPLSGSP